MHTTAQATLTPGVRDGQSTRIYEFDRITTTYNPRNVFTQLNKEENGGLELVNTKNPEKSCLHIVQSDDMDVVHQFVCDMFEHENDRETEDSCLCGLAESLAHRQIQPCTVRRASKQGDRVNFGLVAGGRRLVARALLVAVSRLLESGKKFPKAANHLVDLVRANKPFKAEIEAIQVNCTALEAYDLAVRENKQRKPFNPIEDGKIYADYLKMIDPGTVNEKNPEGKKFNLKTLAKYLGEEYQHVRGRHALYKYYPPEKHQKVVEKKVNLTHAIQQALAKKSGKSGPEGDGAKTKKRRNLMPRPEVEQLFDGHRDEPAAMMVLSKVLMLDFDEAIKESDLRLERAAETD